jgi:hypothetical protein
MIIAQMQRSQFENCVALPTDSPRLQANQPSDAL